MGSKAAAAAVSAGAGAVAAVAAGVAARVAALTCPFSSCCFEETQGGLHKGRGDCWVPLTVQGILITHYSLFAGAGGERYICYASFLLLQQQRDSYLEAEEAGIQWQERTREARN